FLLIIAIILFLTKPDDNFLRDQAYQHIKTEISPKVLHNDSVTVLTNQSDTLLKDHISIRDRIVYKEVNYSEGDTPMVIGYGILKMYRGRNLTPHNAKEKQ
ncbi:MAG: hypothetical protein JWN76_1330, partial [Chitinophagaceae bacterium]|nr:hypothetical protein [Chitinophagaceae bacterium]